MISGGPRLTASPGGETVPFTRTDGRPQPREGNGVAANKGLESQMHQQRERRPSPAFVLALAALIVALAGTAMAAPTAIKSVLNKKEKKQAGNIATNKVLQLAPGLSVANARALGGVGSEGYVRADCGGLGAIKGFAYVPASGSFSGSTFTTVSGQNCSGGAIEAKRTGVGSYEVRFTGNPATLALGMSLTQSGGGLSNSFVSMRQIAAGWFQVVNYSQGAGGGDVPFVVILI